MGYIAVQCGVTVDPCLAGLYPQRVGNQLNAVCRFNAHAFNILYQQLAVFRLVLKPSAVLEHGGGAVFRVVRRREGLGINGGQRKGSFKIAAHAQQHDLLPDGGLPPCARVTGAQGEPVNPVGFEVARFHPAQPVNRIHFGHNAGADQVGDKAHYFGQMIVHELKVTYKSSYLMLLPL